MDYEPPTWDDVKQTLKVAQDHACGMVCYDGCDADTHYEFLEVAVNEVERLRMLLAATETAVDVYEALHSHVRHQG